MKKPAIKSLLSLTAAGLLLAGCAQSPSTAANIDDTTISESDVDSLVAACDAAGAPLTNPNTPAGAGRSQIVLAMAANELVERGKLGEVAPSEAEAKEFLATQLPPEVLADDLCGSFLVNNMRFAYGMEAFGQSGDEAETKKQFNELFSKIELNPKYGRFQTIDGVRTYTPNGSMASASTVDSEMKIG